MHIFKEKFAKLGFIVGHGLVYEWTIIIVMRLVSSSLLGYAVMAEHIGRFIDLPGISCVIYPGIIWAENQF